MTVIHNGIDRVPASRSASGARRFLTLSRLAPEKNLPAVLGAFSAVRADLPDATLTVAGTGSQLNLLRETAAAIGLSDSVKFPGHVDAADALALLGDAGATEALIAALSDAEEPVRFAALVALGHLEGERAGRAVEEAQHSPDERTRLVARRLVADRQPR